MCANEFTTTIPGGTPAERVEAILRRDDGMSLDDANLIANAIDGGPGYANLLDWLRDMAAWGGLAIAPRGPKLAAIVRGLLLSRDREDG